MDFQLGQLWTTGGVVLGFALTSFAWRIQREVDVGRSDDVRLAPADYLNLTAIAVLVSGVFVGPLVNDGWSVQLAARSLGLALVLYAGHAFSLAGHYELFSTGRTRSHAFFPPMERVTITVTVGLAVVYVVYSVASA